MTDKKLISRYEIENATIGLSRHIQKKIAKPDWTDFSEEQLWIMLVSCILGSHVRYETANASFQRLIDYELLNINKILASPAVSKEEIATVLKKPTSCSNYKNMICTYPHPKSKADYIVETAKRIYESSGTSLKEILKKSDNEYVARENLVKKAKGIGYKQASLYLRNIGFTDNLAILDTHVVRYMNLIGLLTVDVKPRILHKNEYLRTERKLVEYANMKRILLSALDAAIWIIMRIVQREYALWK